MRILQRKHIAAVAIIAIVAVWIVTSFITADEPAIKAKEPALAGTEADQPEVTPDTPSSSILRYEQYAARYSNAVRPDGIGRIEAEAFAGTHGMKAEILDSFEQAASPVVRTEESGSIYWDIEVPEDGLYHFGLRYFPVAGNSSPIEREFRIDGALPFEEANRLVFSRVWRNERPDIQRDRNENDLRPRQVESPKWQDKSFSDAESYFQEPFSFYMTKGKHRIELVSLREPMVIDYLQFFQEKQLPSYEELAGGYDAQGYKVTNDVMIKLQGEDALYKSSPSLYPINDRSSPGTEPYHVSKIRMNTIGGINWKIPGQWITWETDIPEDGLYEIGFRYKQNLSRGVNVVRKLYIDDQIPFKEAEHITFQYDGAWQVGVAGPEEQPYLFYLTKGKHEIKLEVTMGELSEVIQSVRKSIQELNKLYRQIIMITGTEPDAFRDYQLEKLIPGMTDMFLKQSKSLEAAADRMDQLIGGASESATILRTTSYQLGDLGSRPETLTDRLKNFKDNVTSLGTWLLGVNQQPLELDYLFVKSPDAGTPKATTGFFSRLKHDLLSFASSFTEDYNNVGSGFKDDSVVVWVNGGRDQAQLIRSMIDNSFTPETGIKIDLQLVDSKVLLPSTLAGKGPDVALSTGEVVNFAMRHALEDLSKYPGFDDVRERFMDSAFVGFTYQNGIFAIPEKQSFPMLFYRKDILEELKLKVPDSWTDLYHVIPVLQKHHMQVGMTPTPVFEMLLYQNGGQYYKDEGMRTDLDSSVGIKAFKKWTELYNNYKLPQEFEFVNRFRTGEMPLGIADYTTYNTLTIFAPEIRGQWGFAPVPGVLGEDGEIHRETLSTSIGTVMFKNTKNKDAAWKFIDWWTDTEAQATFGRELEALLGESGRYAAANIAAMKQLPWSAKEYNQLMSQWEWVRGMPDVPGGYSLVRHVQNAFYSVINSKTDPRETLLDYVRTINEEITIKRKEFKLPTAEEKGGRS
ncbi:extracellular solute-binding protein [Paenibacillus spongiae]|uniref:Extracellular solute-binding protein n=1 Tax=Paenibacillus spongiae TaxID=2909671 RepID=A0ABY5SCZ2_9BACL|nr:extracellular solute-binding protein [Paenibacillus spongiae]UVI31822.1 extracellular solute-binding protein [Paenibacillus spongiae]